MSILCIIVAVLLSVGVADARRALNYDEEPTPEDLFGVLGIFPSFCESKIGGSFKKCQTPAPVASPQMMMGKGKGGRRATSVKVQDIEINEDITDAFNALSSDDKKRLLIAIQHDDVEMVDKIFDGDHNDGRKLPVNMDNEPTPEDLFGVLGIFPSFCESKIGGSFKKCQTPAPVASPQMMMGKGKGGRRATSVKVQDIEINEDITDAFNALSSDDKKRLLIAIQHDDVELVDEIFEGERQLQRNGGFDNEPTPEDLFGKLGIFPSFCESKIGKKLVKCLTEPPVQAPVGMGKRVPTRAPVGKGMKTAPTPAPVKSMMGKRSRRRVVEDEEHDDVADELLQLYNIMTLNDKKRLLLAIEQDDENLMDELLAQYHHRF